MDSNMDYKKTLFLICISAIGLMIATGNIFKDPEQVRKELARLNDLPKEKLTKKERHYKQYWTVNALIFKIGWKVAIVTGVLFILAFIFGRLK
jgi:hypothetical protein